MKKKSATKSIAIPNFLGKSGDWIVRFGSLNAGPGAAGGVKRLFRVVGEKPPFDAINPANSYLRSHDIRPGGSLRGP